MVRYRLEVGHIHEVKPGNIVGAIANEAGLDSQYIGQINIYDDYSVIDLPDGMPKDVFNDLKKVWVAGQQLRISNISKAPKSTKFSSRSKDRKKRKDTNKGTMRSKVSRKKPVRRKWFSWHEIKHKITWYYWLSRKQSEILTVISTSGENIYDISVVAYTGFLAWLEMTRFWDFLWKQHYLFIYNYHEPTFIFK